MDRVKGLLQRLETGKLAPVVQFVKFGLVGVSNTLISYGIEMLCYYVLFATVSWSDNVRIAITSMLAFVVSVTNSYYWNNRYVFGDGIRKTVLQHLKAYLKTVVCYGVTGLVIAPLLKMWLSGADVPYWIASLGALIVTIPLNFIMNKLWAFRTSKDATEG